MHRTADAEGNGRTRVGRQATVAAAGLKPAAKRRHWASFCHSGDDREAAEGVGWTSGGHTGEDVVLYVWSPDGDNLTGGVENTDVALYMARKLGASLDDASKRLFVLARDAFGQIGAKVVWNAEDVSNPVPSLRCWYVRRAAPS